MDDLKRQLMELISEEVDTPVSERRFPKPNLIQKEEYKTDKKYEAPEVPGNLQDKDRQEKLDDFTAEKPARRKKLKLKESAAPRSAYFDNLLEHTSRQISAQVEKPAVAPLTEQSAEFRIRKLEEDFINVLAKATPNTLVNGLGASFTDSGGGTTWLWDLDDVDIGTPMNGAYPIVNNGDAILYDEVTNTWKPGSPGGTYTLPIATDTRLGGIQTGTDFVTDADGNLSLSSDVTLPGDLVPSTDSFSDIGDDSHYLQYL